MVLTSTGEVVSPVYACVPTREILYIQQGPGFFFFFSLCVNYISIKLLFFKRLVKGILSIPRA